MKYKTINCCDITLDVCLSDNLLRVVEVYPTDSQQNIKKLLSAEVLIEIQNIILEGNENAI